MPGRDPHRELVTAQMADHSAAKESGAAEHGDDALVASRHGSRPPACCIDWLAGMDLPISLLPVQHDHVMLQRGNRRRRFLPIGRAVEWLSFVLALSVIVLIAIAVLTWWAP
jgi:hypothetical protein